MKKILWKDIIKSISNSKGRFFSIMGLMLIGSFALVGLKVTGPNMRSTGENYFNKLNTTDLTIIGTLGIDDDDIKEINKAKNIKKIEYGYLKDVVIKNTTTSIRLFSKGEEISNYEIVSGDLPNRDNEIALDNSFSTDYKIGDSIEFNEKADISGNKILKEKKFEIVGFVYSGEILSSINQGPSTVGSGSLNGYGVIPESTFDSDIYMLARLTFKSLDNIDPYSDKYTNLLQNHKNDLGELLKDQPNIRLTAIKKEAQDQIDEGQNRIKEAKKKLTNTKKQLSNGKEELNQSRIQIKEAQNELETKVSDAEEKISIGTNQFQFAQKKIEQTEKKLLSAGTQLQNGKNTLNEKWNQLQGGKTQLDAAQQNLVSASEQLNNGAVAINQGKQKINTAYREIQASQEKIEIAQSQMIQAEQELSVKQSEYDIKNSDYQVALSFFSENKQKYDEATQQIQLAQNNLDIKREQLEINKQEYEQNIAELAAKQNGLEQQLEDLNLTDEQSANIKSQLDLIISELFSIQQEYEQFVSGTYELGIAQILEEQTQLDYKREELSDTEQTLNTSQQQLADSRQQLDIVYQQLSSANSEISQKKQVLKNSQTQLTEAQNTLNQQAAILEQKEEEYQTKLAQYNSNITKYNSNLSSYYKGLSEWEKGLNTLEINSSEYQLNKERLSQVKNELEHKQKDLSSAESLIAKEKEVGERKINDAKTKLGEKQNEYDKKNEEYENKKTEVEKELLDKQVELEEAQETLDTLPLPVYSINSRREIPGGEGNKIYTNVSNIIDSLANIFPIFLYFVASLVTLTTMARFVDEERTKSGTLKALGYSNYDIMKKFIFYGFTSSVSGTIIGIILGHTLLPLIVYNAYHSGFTLPQIEFHFHWGISIIAILLALISSVVPAFLVSSRELKEKPGQLLLPKPPATGSKILLERITPLWKKMSFTHKVTARNIFRYKQRMLMTIFGVAGAVALLFSGFSVQYSIGGINNRQFGDLIHYDIIVAENDYISNKQKEDLTELLNSSKVQQHTTIHYEELTKVAGKNKDTQDIKLIVPEKKENFSDYISFNNRKNTEQLLLPDDGVIISERLATLLDVKEGDTIKLQDSNQIDKQMKVTGITEMYIGHFAFTSKLGYEKIFGTNFKANGQLVNLKDNSTFNTKKQAADFISLDGVAGVVQNTTLTNQINVIVHSLDKIMTVLIVVAALLGIVILYNLTNINVSERMRELSTIKVLGFYDKEVTLYIYRETILLTILGIMTGFGIGEILHQYIITVVPPDDVMFNPALSPISFIVPTLIIGVVTVILAFIINKRLKNVDMLEALKSID